MAAYGTEELIRGKDNMWAVCFRNHLNLDEHEIRLNFTKYGDVANIRNSGIWCFVRFHREAEARAAIEDNSNQSVLGDFVKAARCTIKPDSGTPNDGPLAGTNGGPSEIEGLVESSGKSVLTPINISSQAELDLIEFGNTSTAPQSNLGGYNRQRGGFHQQRGAHQHNQQRGGFNPNRGGSDLQRGGYNQERGGFYQPRGQQRGGYQPRGAFSQQRGGYNEQRGGIKGGFSQQDAGYLQRGHYQPPHGNFLMQQSNNFPPPSLSQFSEPQLKDSLTSKLNGNKGQPKFNIATPFITPPEEDGAVSIANVSNHSNSNPGAALSDFANRKKMLEKKYGLPEPTTDIQGGNLSERRHFRGPGQAHKKKSNLASSLNRQMNLGGSLQNRRLNQRLPQQNYPLEDSLSALRDDIDNCDPEEDFGEAVVGDVIIGNYPNHLLEEEIWELFGGSNVIDISLHYTKQNYPYCHVLVSSEEKMDELLACDGEDLMGHRLIIGVAEEFISIGFSKVYGEREQRRGLGAFAHANRM